MPLRATPDHVILKSVTLDSDPDSGSGDSVTLDSGTAATKAYVDGVSFAPQWRSAASFGAVGDGTTDDTAALQDALDDTADTGGVLYFPPGVYKVTQTLTAGRAQGVRLVGSGCSTRSVLPSEEGSFPQHVSAILWRGADGGTVLDHNGSDCTIDGLSIWGGLDSDAGGADRAGIGFHLKEGVGTGAGKNNYPHLCITHCDVGYQAGTATDDTNCDVLNFGLVKFRYCGRGFVVKHDQGVSYNFGTLHCNDVDICIDFERGGGLNVEKFLGANTPVLLKVQGAGPTFGQFRMAGVTLDGAQAERVVWFQHVPPTANLDFCSVVFDGGMGGTNGLEGVGQGGTATAAFQIAGRCKLVVRNVANGMTNSWDEIGSTVPSPLLQITGTDARYASAAFEHCGLDDTDTTTSDWYILDGAGTTRRRVITNCHRGSVNTPVANIDTTA